MCVFSSHTDISTIGMAQDLFGLLTKLIITIMYIVKYLWFFQVVHCAPLDYLYILYYILAHVFMYSETSCSSSSNNSYFNGCLTDAA